MTRFVEFYILFSLISVPVSYISGSLFSYGDIKIVLISSLISICTFDLIINRNNILIPTYVILAFIYLILKITLISPIINLGLQFQSIVLTLVSIIIPLWIYNNNLNIKKISLLIYPSLIITLASCLGWSLFKFPLFSLYAPFSTPVGLKNSSSVFIAQLMPFLLISLYLLKLNTNNFYFFLKTIIATLLCLSFWVIILNRTRSAWWMIIILIVSLIFYSIKIEKEKIKLLMFILCSCSFSLILLTFIPNSLNWKSDTPYLDSLYSLFSLEKSSGRNELWAVGIDIISKNMLFGIGTSNYPLIWQNFIPNTNISPKTFGFLRPDLPILNDYLQSVIENGLIGGIFFLIIYFIYPIYLFFKNSNDTLLYLLFVSCFTISIDALFDYPFSRSENILLFSVSVGYLLKQIEKAKFIVNKQVINLLLVFILIFSSFITSKLGAAIYFRKKFNDSEQISYLRSAWEYWPWDLELNARKIDILWHAGEKELAKTVAEKRIKYWPNDPESYLMNATVSELNGNIDLANNFYLKSIIRVKGGKCYYEGYHRYKIFKNKYNINPDEVTLNEIKSCL